MTILLRLILALAILLQPYAIFPTLHLQSTSAQESNSDDKAAILADGAEVYTAIQDGKTLHSLDVFRLLVQTAHDFKKPVGFDLNAISLEIIDRNGQVLQNIGTRELLSFEANGPHQEIYLQLTYQGKVFLKYNRPVTSAAFVNNTLVFTDKMDSENALNPKVKQLLFIDLNKFRSSIGESALPVFRLPIESEQNISYTKKSREELILSPTLKINSQVIEAFSEAQETAFYATATMSDPKKMHQMEPVLNSLETYFLQAVALRGSSLQNELINVVGGEEKFKEFARNLQTDLQSQANMRDELKKSTDKAVDEKLQPALQPQIDKIAGEISKQKTSQNKLMTRIRLAWGALTAPQPKAAPKIATALALVAGSFKKKSASDVKEALRHVAANPSVQMGVAITGGLLLGYHYPQEMGAFFYNSLDVARTVGEVVFGKIKDLGHVFLESARATFYGFNPIHFKEAYLSPERLPKVGIGLMAIVTTLYASLGLPHLITNSYFLAKDLKKVSWQEKIKTEGSIWAAVKNAVIERQQKVQSSYLAALSQDTKHEGVGFTESDDAEVNRLVQELENRRQKGLLSRWLMKNSEKKEPAGVKIETFGQALRHFLFSYATFTIAGKAYTAIWNSWFAIRSFIWNPGIVAATLVFPNYWALATKGIRPTSFNGGSRTLFQQLSLKMIHADELKNLEIWEKHLQGVEQKMDRAVLSLTFQATAAFLKNHKDLKEYYEKGAPNKITDKIIGDLTHEQRTFFRAYYDSLLEATTQKYMEDKGISSALKNQDASSLSSNPEQYSVSDSDIAKYISQIDKESLAQKARELASHRWTSDHFATNYVHNLISNLDGQNNRQVARIQSVNRQTEKPKAMARAVRSMIASNVIDKPLELMFTFVCMAGITSGLLAPIQDDMFSENSWFHLSKMVFSNGFIYGVISGVLADVWMKLQQDELHDGQFEDVPKGEDAEKGFMRFFWKKFNDPNNSLWKNQVHYVKIIWANMKAAFTTMALVGLVTMGRLDLDAYIVGYLFSFFTPLSGFAFKLEQAFEMASSYFAKDIPEKFRAHPRAQEYLNSTIAKKRLWFNLFYKTYENIMGYLMLNFQQMKTAAFGTRSFSRVLLNGYTWTEVAVAGLDKAGKALSAIPGGEKLAELCQKLISNNYTDFEKIKPPGGK